MNISAALGTTPYAFTGATGKSGEAAAKASAGYGAATMQQIQVIDEQVISLLAKAATEQAGEVNTSKPQAPGTPELRQADLPRLMRAAQQQNQASPAQQQFTPEAVLLMISMQLSVVIKDENSRSLASQLELVKARLAARAASAAELSEAIKLAQAVVEAALGEAGVAEGELAAAAEALKKAQADVARLEQELAAAPPAEQDAIRAQLEAAKANVAVQQGRLDAAHAKLNEALRTVDSALKDLEDFKTQADQIDPSRSISARGDDKALSNQAELEFLLATLQKIIGDANLKKFAKDTEFVQAMLKAREAENLRRSEEYQRELEKAEQAQKKMGCLGKIIGWVVTVVAVIAAPFTGGASMALAGIGLALAIGQEFGFDPLGKVLEPIMKLIMKLVQEVAKVVGSVLKSLGVSADIVDKIKDVIAIIAVAAMVVAIAFVSKKVASTAAVQMVTKAVTKAVTDAISKALPAIIKAAAHAVKQAVDDVAAALTKSVSKVVGTSSDTLARRAGQATTAMHVMQFANQTSQGVGSIVIADMHLDAAKMLAELERGMADSAIFRDLIQMILDYYLQTNTLIAALFDNMTDVREIQDQTSSHLTTRIGAVAA
ncbi:type III secretion system translocon subunit SctE [Stenotrophomonas sp. PS02289]|uniref:type III secretion system translocon subunit SctE n=1 Tax=Stenotrophomonas sp. PS02289 TaxID=2991422 RepID=UPI00249CC9A9|nr:type III secretion system translocon subunit SctE [Stenotrophomonas sp. PS02289]